MKKGVPGRGTKHPRAFALAPGGDSGAMPTAMAIRAGQKWPLQTDVGANNFAHLGNYLQWRPALEIELSRFKKDGHHHFRQVVKGRCPRLGILCQKSRLSPEDDGDQFA